MVISIPKWTEYNPRTDSKRPSWFRLENSLALGSGLFGLDSEQKWLWVVILSLISEGNGAPIEWNSGYVGAMTGIKEKRQMETIEIFEKREWLRVDRASHARVTQGNILNSHATNETNERTNEHSQSANADRARLFVEVEKIYQESYPRKQGKTPGLNRLKGQIHTPADVELFRKSIAAFCARMKKENRPPDKIMHFATFAGQWRDWAEHPGDKPPQKPVNEELKQFTEQMRKIKNGET